MHSAPLSVKAIPDTAPAAITLVLQPQHANLQLAAATSWEQGLSNLCFKKKKKRRLKRRLKTCFFLSETMFHTVIKTNKGSEQKYLRCFL